MVRVQVKKTEPAHWTDRIHHSMFFCFGGGCLIGLMIGEPFSIFRSDDYIVVYAVTWFTLFFTPLRKLIHTPVVEVCCAGDGQTESLTL